MSQAFGFNVSINTSQPQQLKWLYSAVQGLKYLGDANITHGNLKGGLCLAITRRVCSFRIFSYETLPMHFGLTLTMALDPHKPDAIRSHAQRRHNGGRGPSVTCTF